MAFDLTQGLQLLPVEMLEKCLYLLLLGCLPDPADFTFLALARSNWFYFVPSTPNIFNTKNLCSNVLVATVRCMKTAMEAKHGKGSVFVNCLTSVAFSSLNTILSTPQDCIEPFFLFHPITKVTNIL
jgi:hypothetical protein